MTPEESFIVSQAIGLIIALPIVGFIYKYMKIPFNGIPFTIGYTLFAIFQYIMKFH